MQIRAIPVRTICISERSGVKGKTNYKNIFANLSLSVSNEIINNKIGDLEDIQDVSKIVTSVSNDIVIDQMKGAVMDDDTLNNTPDKNKTKE